MPTIVGHYLIEGPLAVHGLVVLDIANAAKPVEVSRLKLGECPATAVQPLYIRHECEPGGVLSAPQ